MQYLLIIEETSLGYSALIKELQIEALEDLVPSMRSTYAKIAAYPIYRRPKTWQCYVEMPTLGNHMLKDPQEYVERFILGLLLPCPVISVFIFLQIQTQVLRWGEDIGLREYCLRYMEAMVSNQQLWLSVIVLCGFLSAVLGEIFIKRVKQFVQLFFATLWS